MNPIKMFKLYELYSNFQSTLKENVPVNVKIPQLIHLLTSAVGIIGVPTMADKWLHQSTHLAIYAVAVGISLLLHAISPNIFGGPSDQAQKDTGYSKFVAILVILILGSMLAQAQDTLPPAPQPGAIYAAGLSYSVNASPAIAGTGLYAYPVAGSQTYAFTSIDVLPNTIKPFTVTTNMAIGVGQKFTTFGKYDIYCTTGAGPSWSGSNIGWSYNFGCLTEVTIKKQRFLPTFRALKSSVSNGTGLQPIIGILYRF